MCGSRITGGCHSPGYQVGRVIGDLKLDFESLAHQPQEPPVTHEKLPKFHFREGTGRPKFQRMPSQRTTIVVKKFLGTEMSARAFKMET